MRTSYNPFERDEERQTERIAAAREEHQLWSLEQARLGRSAAQRENNGVWIKQRLLPEAADEPFTAPATAIPAPRS